MFECWPTPFLPPSIHIFFSLIIPFSLLPSFPPIIHSFLYSSYPPSIHWYILSSTYSSLPPSLPLITPQFFLPSSIPHSLPPTISSPTLFSPKGSESRWHAERSAQGRQIERLNDELVRSHRAKDVVEAESRRISHVSVSGSFIPTPTLACSHPHNNTQTLAPTPTLSFTLTPTLTPTPRRRH